MSMTLVNFRLDTQLKKLETLCNELGMSLTTAFTVFAKKVREQGIQFYVNKSCVFLQCEPLEIV